MDTKRVIRAPATITNPSKPNLYNGNLSRTKFRLIRPINSPSATSDLPSSTTGTITSTNSPARTRIPAPKSSSSSKINETRIVTSTSSITRPVSVTKTSISRKQEINQPQRPKTSSIATLKFQPVRLASVKEFTALKLENPSNAITTSTPNNNNNNNNNQDTHPNGIEFISASALAEDVGEIRNLLQRLFNDLHVTSTFDEKEDALLKENKLLAEENKALKEELDKLRMTVENINLSSSGSTT